MQSKSFSASDVPMLWHQLDVAIGKEINANLGIIFCSPKFDITQIAKIFTDFNIDIIGCTTAGEITNSELSEETISVILFDINKDYYQILFDENKKNIKDAAINIRHKADLAYENPAIFALTAGIFNDGEEIVEGLKMGRQKEIPIFGGLSGDNLMLEKTTIFTNNEISNNGINAIVFNANHIEINGLATSGWKTLGAEHTITKAEGNVVYTINNEPALDYFIRFFGSYDNGLLNEKQISTISAQYPFQVKKEGGHSVLRSPINSDPKKRSLILLGKIEEGATFKFSISPGIEVIDETVNIFQEFKNTTAQEANALILVSCKGRHAALGPFIEDEISQIYDFWQKPMIGFLSYGEIGNLNNGICEFHNETCCLITLKEI